jgi:HPt (histidine-containing phosphotransfer) domain-containing protein
VSEQGAPAPVLDPDRFAELAADFGEEGARELIDALIAETDRQLTAATAAHEAGDRAALAHEAHGVKGGALLVGATRLHAAAAALERAARDGAATHGGLDALSAAWASTRPCLTDPQGAGR